MNHPDLDLMVQIERRKEEIAAADNARLVKAAMLSAGKKPKSTTMGLLPQSPLLPLVVILARVMARLGSLLTLWSCRLQQYSGREEQPAPCSG